MKTETVKNITVEWNSISNGVIDAVYNNDRTNQSSEEQEFPDSDKTFDSAITISPLHLTPSRNLRNIFNKITEYPIKPNLRYLGKCHKSFKFCQKACRLAYRETCKELQCKRKFRKEMKQQCDISCDKVLEDV